MGFLDELSAVSVAGGGPTSCDAPEDAVTSSDELSDEVPSDPTSTSSSYDDSLDGLDGVALADLCSAVQAEWEGRGPRAGPAAARSEELDPLGGPCEPETPLHRLHWSLWAGLEVSIPSWQWVRTRHDKLVPFYRIQLTNSVGLKWSVLRRYSRFERLHQRLIISWRMACLVAHRRTTRCGPAGLRLKDPVSDCPALPSTKRLGWTNGNAQHVEQRRVDLEVYIRALLQFPKHGANARCLVEDFLDVPAVRVAQGLLAAPRHLPDPYASAGHRLPAYCVPDAEGPCLVQGLDGCPDIVLTPPETSSMET
eukprot:EG_transcript_8029